MAQTVVAANDPLALPGDPTATISVKTEDGKSISVKAWEDIVYVKKPTDINFHFPPIPTVPEVKTTQKLNIYVPSSASAGSPIVLYVDNGGWFTNTKPVKLKDGDIIPANGSRTAAIGAALKAGYIAVTYTCRGRNDSPNDGKYFGHSPATMTDTKAVIRYLRYNDAVLPGDSNKVVVTGTSGGGALTSVLSASGDSPDYYPSLYEIGAAGMTSSTTSTISDAVFAAIAYCPITDLPHADQAYEWVYGSTREAYKKDGLSLAQVNPSPKSMGAPTSTDQVYGDSVLAASKELTADYVKYFNSLGLKDEKGNLLKADDGTFQAAIKSLLEKGAEKELGTTQFKSSDKAPADGDYKWLTIKDGKATIDWDKYLYWIGTEKTGFKTAPAFSNKGTPNQHPALNEDNIFGTQDQAYSPFEFWSWNNHIAENITVGKNNTKLDWDAYLKTDAGKALSLQMKMTNPIPYLQSTTDGKSAPYWYVRHGMADRDTSFAVEATLYYALKKDNSVKDVNFNYEWLKPHSGDYDVAEAYAWLAGIMAKEGYTPNPFTDVSFSDWSSNDILTAVTAGVMNGKTASTFAPGENLTYAETVKLAASMNQKYSTGSVTLKNGSPWYQTYVDYAKKNNIIDKDYDWNANVTRADFMAIIAKALPESALAAKNTVKDGAIKDVPDTSKNTAIYKLYRAGIIQGVDKDHNCKPASSIKRGEAAAILNRIMNSSARISFSM
jgi:acetyl esterase/lipase